MNRDEKHPDPEWTAEIRNRRKGATTFKTCGWCKHATVGRARYSCMLSTRCDLLKEYGIGDTHWDTPCIVKKLGKLDFKDIVGSKRLSIQELRNSIGGLKEDIKVIKGLKLKNKPPLPSNRSCEYYNVGEVIYVMLVKKKKWVKATVVSGYRHHDGCVSFMYGKKEGGAGYAIPGLLKEWEFKYFKANPQEFREWLELSEEDEDREGTHDYYKALIKLEVK